MHNDRSEDVKYSITLLIRLLYLWHSFGLKNSVHALQLVISFWRQQLFILHQEAFVFSVQPGRLPFLNLLQLLQ